MRIPLVAPAWAHVFGEDRHGIFAEFGVEGVRFVMRWIPPGWFRMGSPSDEGGRLDDEGPQHDVTISSGFWLGETPITQAQYRAVGEARPSHFKGDSRPAEQISWDDVQEFCGLLRQRHRVPAGLPTEAQWEYACRAGTQGAYHVEGSKCTKPLGRDPVLDDLGWFDENSGTETKDVALKRPNAWGLYDMHGNVWEWCRDGQRDYSPDAVVDPVGDETGAFRVVRGGSWGDDARGCRAAARYRSLRAVRGDDLGFRLFAGQEQEQWPEAAEPLGAERPRATAPWRGTGGEV